MNFLKLCEALPTPPPSPRGQIPLRTFLWSYDRRCQWDSDPTWKREIDRPLDYCICKQSWQTCPHLFQKFKPANCIHKPPPPFPLLKIKNQKTDLRTHSSGTHSVPAFKFMMMGRPTRGFYQATDRPTKRRTSMLVCVSKLVVTAGGW